MIDLISSQIAEQQEKVMIEVLRQILNRAPTLEDAKDVTIFQKEGEN